jgi:secreted trypsin-like serine protease
MRKLLALVAALVGALAIAVAPGSAITGNFVEDFEHPYVGLVVFYDADGEFMWRCSGSLLTPTVFLTAGHCTDQNADESPVTARVYFQQDAGVNYDPVTEVDPVTGYPETCADSTLGVTCATSDQLYNYDYTGRLPNTHDIGLLILDQPISLSEYGQLAEAGSLDQLATQRGLQDLIFTVSGYGLTYKNQPQNGKANTSFRERLEALAHLVNLNSAINAGFNLQTGGNGTGEGGTCNGDSGGPVLYGGFDSDIIVAVTSFGLNALCRGTDFAYRTDQQDVIDWILATVAESGTTYDDIQIVSI